jgi:lipoyl-dependent peroxiredoxin
MIEKYGSAHWEGGLKDGTGTVSTETGVLSGQSYSFATRFEGSRGTNPEELIGAAHAACFAMAMSNELGKAGLKADSIDARSTVTLDPSKGAITKVHVVVTAAVPGASAEQFQEIAETTKAGCPVSKVLAAAEITMDASLA